LSPAQSLHRRPRGTADVPAGRVRNHFLALFHGECTLCHKLDAKSGAWAIPSGPEK
jgi:hypothetical protein